MYLDPGFKTRLKSAMEARDPPINQSELARHISTSIRTTPQTVQQWCSGHTSPRRNRLVLAAESLHVRVDWLAHGRGPMRAPDLEAKTSHTSSPNTEDSLLTTEWERALDEALPAGDNTCRNQHIRHPLCQSKLFANWLSDSIVANLMLYPSTAALIPGARERLWDLLILRDALPPHPNRMTMLLLSPLDNGSEVPIRHLIALRAEARLLGLEVVHAETPLQAAAILLGKEARQMIPIADDLGLNPSMPV